MTSKHLSKPSKRVKHLCQNSPQQPILQLTWLLASSRDFTHRHACVNMPMGPCRNYLGR
uniref:Uncharacterized protein n=1 Tax=Helianthus annuus TaxID=4232 RepID=A0A1Y3BYA3_HELAN